MKNTIMVCVTSMVLLAGLGFAQDPAAITGWTVQENLVYDYVDSGEGAEYVIHPTQMAGGVIVGNRIYMVGGYNTRRENGGWDDTNYAYSFPINPYDGTVGDCRIEADLPEDEATTLESDACYSYIHEAVVATDTHIYIHGGSWNTGGSNTSDRTVCTYTGINGDTTLQSWSVTAEYPSSYAGELAVAAICENGYLYCFGGHDKTIAFMPRYREMEVWEPGLRQPTCLASPTSPLVNPSAITSSSFRASRPPGIELPLQRKFTYAR